MNPWIRRRDPADVLPKRADNSTSYKRCLWGDVYRVIPKQPVSAQNKRRLAIAERLLQFELRLLNGDVGRSRRSCVIGVTYIARLDRHVVPAASTATAAAPRDRDRQQRKSDEAHGRVVPPPLLWDPAP